MAALVLTGNHIARAWAGQLGGSTPAPAAIIRELALGAGGVADLCVAAPGRLELYEVKGDTDSAARLSRQVADYDAVATSCTLITTWRHVSAFDRRVPAHWGVLVAERGGEACRFRTIRRSTPNPRRQPAMLAAMLHVSDLHAILCRVRRGRPWRHSGVHRLRQLVAEDLDLDALTTLVARALARRKPFEVRQTAAVSLGMPQEWAGIDAILGLEAPPLTFSFGP